MTTGICREVRLTATATGEAGLAMRSRILARSLGVATRARTVQVSVPISTVVVGLARRLWYQAGWVGAPKLDATTATAPSVSGQ